MPLFNPAGGGSGSVTSTEHTSVDSRVNSVNTFLSGISALSAGGVSTHGVQSVINALSNRISGVVGGTGSVTSNEVSAVSQNASLANASILAFLSGISSRSVGDVSTHGIQSVINAISNKTSVLSQAISVVEVHASAASAAATSVDSRVNTVSNLVSVLSDRFTSASAQLVSIDNRLNNVSARSADATASVKGLQSVVNQISNRVSALSQAVSVVSQTVSVLSTRFTSASAQFTSIDAKVSVLSDKVVSISAQLVSEDAKISVLSDKVVSISAQLVSLETHASTASAAATSVDGRVTSVNTALSALSALSAGGVSTHGLQSIINALSNRISGVVGGTGSVTSNEVSAVSAQAASALSAALDVSVKAMDAASVTGSVQGLQSVVDTLSGRISTITPQFRTVSNPAGYTISATALTTISGLSVSITPGASYQLYAHIMYVVLSAAQPTGFGFITNAAAIAVGYGRAMGDVSLVISAGGDALSTTRGLLHFWNQQHFGGTTAVFSVNPGTASPVVHGVIIEGVVACSATMSADQRIHVAARASSGATGAVIVTAGSYIRMLRII
jgi:hypothetical protein